MNAPDLPMNNLRTNILKVVMWDSAFALIPPILLFTLNPSITWGRLVDDFKFSLIYSNCIGGLAFNFIPKVWMVGCQLPQWIRWSTRVAAMYVACVTGSLIAGVFFVALRWQPMSEYWPQFFGSLKLAAFLTIGAGLTIGIYSTLRERLEETTLQLRTKELERERALKLATEAQLASLESRIHPHFLFNTLNSISSLDSRRPGPRRAAGGADGGAAALLAGRQPIRSGAACKRAQDRRGLPGDRARAFRRSAAVSHRRASRPERIAHPAAWRSRR